MERFADPNQRRQVIEELLRRHQGGDEEALQALWHELYEEVHRMARTVLLREGPRRPIDTTVLVHELYLKLGGTSFENRAHLFGSLVRMMGQIVVDAARRRDRAKRREHAVAVETHELALDAAALGLEQDAKGLVSIAITAALDELDSLAPRAAAVAWLRFVGGLSVERTAACLDVSERTVKGDWAFARAWLHRELTSRGLTPRDPRRGEHNAEP